MRKFASVLAALALALLLAAPAAAQDDTVTLGFEVFVTGECPDDTTIFALVGPPNSEFGATQLLDEDGDGVFTGGVEVGADQELVVAVVQGIGTAETEFGTFPGEPITTIEEFSTSEDPLTIDEDTTLEASYACGADDGQDANDDQQDMPAEMPDTGGGAATGLPLGTRATALALLGVSGLLVRRRSRV